MMLEIEVMRLDKDLPLPRYAHPGDAGIDLVAAKDALLSPRGGRCSIPTGLAIAIPFGYAVFIQPRSGLALHHGITCLNSPGLIDSGYRGEIKVVLVNLDPTSPFEVKRFMRIAQLLIKQVEQISLKPVESLDSSERNETGFGHSGYYTDIEVNGNIEVDRV